jgi:hypothetical protein
MGIDEEAGEKPGGQLQQSIKTSTTWISVESLPMQKVKFPFTYIDGKVKRLAVSSVVSKDATSQASH